MQLVDARDGIIAWGDRFSAKAADIPLVQRSIAARIAASLRVNIRETERRAIFGRAPRDLGVYELTLRGVCKFQFSPDAIRAARQTWKKGSVKTLITRRHGLTSLGSTSLIFGCN